VLPNVGHAAADLIRDKAGRGFESIQLAYKNTLAGLDLPRLAEQVRPALAETATVISCLGLYGNTLADNEHGDEIRQGLESLIDHAHAFGTDLVCAFAGRVTGASVPESLPRFREVWMPLVARAEAAGVRLAFENCLQGGTWTSGDRNIAINPAAWELLFAAIPSSALGLQWEPAHQLCQLIEPLPQLRTWAHKVFHVHGKDAEIRHDVLRQHGTCGPERFAHHRFPGLGDTDWARLISELILAGYQGNIDIEGGHDPVYRGPLEDAGQEMALAYLQRCRPRR
jgi:sugar phosphate isomerase/epimerase